MVSPLQLDVEQLLLRALGALADGVGNLVRLAIADADVALLVANDGQGRKTEAAAALNDLGAAVDEDNLLDEGWAVAGRRGRGVAITAGTTIEVAALGTIRIALLGVAGGRRSGGGSRGIRSGRSGFGAHCR